MPVLPLRDVVLFPYVVMPLLVGRAASLSALEVANREDRVVLLVAQRDPEIQEPAAADLYRVGVVARVRQLDGLCWLNVPGQESPVWASLRGGRCRRWSHRSRRHLSTRHGLTGEQYLKRWGMASDHPLTAPTYSEQRSALAKELGLGRGGRQTAPPPATDAPRPRRGRPRGSRTARAG